MARTPYHKAGPSQPNVFNELIERGVREGIIPARTKEAREWYRKAATRASTVSDSELMRSDPARFRNTIVPGRMYMFYYDPKYKKELPYYDRFPLIFPIDVRGDYILGLNLHYLPPRLRAKLMDALYNVINNIRFDETTKLNLSYQILKSTASMKYFRPCIKKYLRRHVRSRFVTVAAVEWDIAIFLDLARFEKASQNKVWADSEIRIERGR